MEKELEPILRPRKRAHDLSPSDNESDTINVSVPKAGPASSSACQKPLRDTASVVNETKKRRIAKHVAIPIRTQQLTTAKATRDSPRTHNTPHVPAWRRLGLTLKPQSQCRSVHSKFRTCSSSGLDNPDPENSSNSINPYGTRSSASDKRTSPSTSLPSFVGMKTNLHERDCNKSGGRTDIQPTAGNTVFPTDCQPVLQEVRDRREASIPSSLWTNASMRSSPLHNFVTRPRRHVTKVSYNENPLDKVLSQEETAENDVTLDLSVFPTSQGKKKTEEDSQCLSNTLSHGGSCTSRQGNLETHPKPKKTSSGPRVGKNIDLSLPPLNNIQDIFKDMVSKALSLGLDEALKALAGQVISVATMCSGTESPLVALEMISKALENNGKPPIQVKHYFSAEIDPMKQAYIERNFRPEKLFRDVRDFIPDDAKTATTAYGAEELIPAHMDILIAGFVCRDLSRLNNYKKALEDDGESGDTWRAVYSYTKKFRPSVVLVENVQNTIDFWNKFESKWTNIDYESAWLYCDTKNYYLPQTRVRMYMIALDRRVFKNNAGKVVQEWKGSMRYLQRQCSSPYDAFLARDTWDLHDYNSLASEPNWALCKLRYDQIRSCQRLGISRPVTRWCENGTVRPPANPKWYNSQSSRVYDCIDIAHLQAALNEYDSLYKMAIWDVSQNVDRFKADLGILPCITPNGCDFATNRQMALTGSQLLVLQGMPYDKLLFAKETQKDLQDLAGNAMSTTVIGASIISTLIYAAKSFRMAPNHQEEKNGHGQGPDELKVPTQLEVHSFTTQNCDDLDVNRLIHEARFSSQLCSCETSNSISTSSIQVCHACMHTACTRCAGNPRHVYNSLVSKDERQKTPQDFEKHWRTRLPSQLKVENFPRILDLAISNGIGDEDLQVFARCIDIANLSSQFFSISHFQRERSLWRVVYSSPNARLELIINKTVQWRLYIKCPLDIPGNSKLRKALEQPLARGSIEDSLLKPIWEIFLPHTCTFPIHLTYSNERTFSWRSRLGLPDYKSETVPLQLEIKTDTKEVDELIGKYILLPNCGTAMSSLYKKTNGCPMYLFLDPNPIGRGNLDKFVFSYDCRHIQYGETRIVQAQLDPSWRPWNVQGETIDSANVMVTGVWIPIEARLIATSYSVLASVPSSSAISTCSQDDCSQAITILDVQLNARIPLGLFSDYAWPLEKAKSLPSFSEWQHYDAPHSKKECSCAPSMPRVLWSVNEDGIATPHEDHKAAAQFERCIKTRAPIFDVRATGIRDQTRIQIGVNIVSLIHRTMNRLKKSEKVYDTAWRLLTDHTDLTMERFSTYQLSNNLDDIPYAGPLRLEYELGEAQKKSLTWMKNQESGRLLTITEVEEAIHAGLGWRVEARARITQRVRGGVLADLPSFGKTVTTIALIQSEFEENEPQILLEINRRLTNGMPALLDVAASLIVTPPHIARQWKSEFERFLGHKQFQAYNILLVERFSELQRLTIKDIRSSRALIVSWSIFAEEAYILELARFAAMPGPAATKGRVFDAWFEYVLKEIPNRLQKLLSTDSSTFNEDTRKTLEARLEHSDFKAVVPLRICHGNAYESFNAMQSTTDKRKRSTVKKQQPQRSSSRIERYIQSSPIPLLQFFRFNRVVIDEFHYLYDGKKNDNYPAYAAVRSISAIKRWILSGTPALANFSDVNQMAVFLGVRLGRDVSGDGFVTTEPEKRRMRDQTDVEKFLSRTEVISRQWHIARHSQAQEFVDQFVRQNEPSLHHVPCSEMLQPVVLGAAHQSVYLELAQHLISQRMQIKKLHSKNRSDRIDRLNASMNHSATAEEALMKASLLFETQDGQSGVDLLIQKRQQQRMDTEAELLRLMLGFETLKKADEDIKVHFTDFKKDMKSGIGLGDADASQTMRCLLSKAEIKLAPSKGAQEFGRASKKELKMFLAQLRSLAQELSLRIRSERFMASIKALLSSTCEFDAPYHYKCSSSHCSGIHGISDLFLISHCGHIACSVCLQMRPNSESCVCGECNILVDAADLIKAGDLCLAEDETSGTRFGKKLDSVASLIKRLPTNDQALVFVPNEETIGILEDVFEHYDITYHSTSKKSSVAKTIENFKTNKDPNDQKTVLILDIMGEATAGINLVNANHIIFVSPLLTRSQYEYESAMTQAIARSRRYGQEKQVYIYHVVALRTIDVDILEHRHRRSDSIQSPNAVVEALGAISMIKEKTILVRNRKGGLMLLPVSWLGNPTYRELMDVDENSERFTSLINFFEKLKEDDK